MKTPLLGLDLSAEGECTKGFSSCHKRSLQDILVLDPKSFALLQ